MWWGLGTQTALQGGSHSPPLCAAGLFLPVDSSPGPRFHQPLWAALFPTQLVPQNVLPAPRCFQKSQCLHSLTQLWSRQTPVQSQAWEMFCFDLTWLLRVLGLALAGNPLHFGPALREIVSSDQRTKGRTRTECLCPPAFKTARPPVAMHPLLGGPELS